MNTKDNSQSDDINETTQNMGNPRRPGWGFSPRSGGGSLGGKFFLLCFLSLLLCIPLFVVWGLVQEREYNYRKVVAEIGRQWGADQTIVGPLIGVPVVVQVTERKNDRDVIRRQTREILITPEALEIDTNIDTTRRKRGIHEAVVYQTQAKLSASFQKPDLAQFSDRIVRVDWSRARLLMSLSDLKGIGEISVTQNGVDVGEIEPGLGGAALTPTQNAFAAASGLHVPIDLANESADTQSQSGQFAFDVLLSFKGSQTLSFVPVGASTKAKMASAWPHPSFYGDFLPTGHDISDSGFTSQWAVSKLARPIPQMAFVGNDGLAPFMASSFGVRFYQPVDFYRMVDRAVKYGVLFVGMAFLVIFSIEVISRGRMHVVHYAMSGMMVIMFYVLLLAIAEMVGFTIAFAIAALATGAVLAGFVASVFPGRQARFGAFAGFTGLYGLLYAILNLEEAALLAGAITGFAILSAAMFATRNVDWFGTNRDVEPQPA